MKKERNEAGASVSPALMDPSGCHTTPTQLSTF